jgi:hypothetical protein
VRHVFSTYKYVHAHIQAHIINGKFREGVFGMSSVQANICIRACTHTSQMKDSSAEGVFSTCTHIHKRIHTHITQEKLGEGASGIVHRGVLSLTGQNDGNNATKVNVAVKFFKSGMSSDGSPDCEMDALLSAGDNQGLPKVCVGCHVCAYDCMRGYVCMYVVRWVAGM